MVHSINGVKYLPATALPFGSRGKRHHRISRLLKPLASYSACHRFDETVKKPIPVYFSALPERRSVSEGFYAFFKKPVANHYT
jgi:hypothetical protein